MSGITIASGATIAGDIAVTGNITGNSKVITISGNDTLTIPQCRNVIILITGAYTPVLPAVSGFPDSEGAVVTFIANTATTYSVDPNGVDRIVLYNTALSDGEKATSPGTLGASITFVGTTSAGWHALRGEGIFVNGG